MQVIPQIHENNLHICSYVIMQSWHDDKNWFEEFRLWLESEKNNVVIAYVLSSQDFFNHLCFLHSISFGFLYVRSFKILKSELFAFTLSHSCHDMSNAALKRKQKSYLFSTVIKESCSASLVLKTNADTFSKSWEEYVQKIFKVYNVLCYPCIISHSPTPWLNASTTK